MCNDNNSGQGILAGMFLVSFVIMVIYQGICTLIFDPPPKPTKKPVLKIERQYKYTLPETIAKPPDEPLPVTIAKPPEPFNFKKAGEDVGVKTGKFGRGFIKGVLNSKDDK